MVDDLREHSPLASSNEAPPPNERERHSNIPARAFTHCMLKCTTTAHQIREEAT
jgi:hypothetical protein